MSATGQAANASAVAAQGGGIATAGAKAVQTLTLTDWINDNAIITGIFCTVLSLIMSMIFNLINRRDSKAKQLEERKLKATVGWIREGKTDEEITILLKRTGLE